MLGGTGFLGPHIVEARARAATRSRCSTAARRTPSSSPTSRSCTATATATSRRSKAASGTRSIDTSGYVPRIVKMSAELLAPSVEQYVFISTISVYKRDKQPNVDETAPVDTLDDPTNEDVEQDYGALKASASRPPRRRCPGASPTVRPGLIVGPGDPTGRFTYWPVRLADGGEVLAPGDGRRRSSSSTSATSARGSSRVIEGGTTGIYNALGPEKPITMKEVLDGVQRRRRQQGQLTWVDANFLEKQEVAPWSEMPMWIDPTATCPASARCRTRAPSRRA